MSKLPPFIAQRYEYISLLGKGGMGNVYLAKDKKLPRKVAIKVVANDLAEDENILARIKRESQLHGKITNHPNIVTLYDLLEEDGQLALVMEYVDGDTLSSRLQKNLEAEVTFSQEKSVSLVKQLLSALQRLHSVEVVHRDIKPENLMIGKDDNGNDVLKLMDFGIAKSDAEDIAQTMITKVGHSTPGTPAYMSPEQIDSQTYGDATAKSDLYAVGVILYEMLLGAPPFNGSLTQVFTGHLTQPIRDKVDTSKLPPYWINLICKALEKMPDKRFSSAEKFSQAFDVVSGTEQSNANANSDATRINKTEYAEVVNQNKTMLWNDEDDDNHSTGTQLFDEESAINDILGKAKSAEPQPKKSTALVISVLVGLTILAIGGFAYLQNDDSKIDTTSTEVKSTESSKENTIENNENATATEIAKIPNEIPNEIPNDSAALVPIAAPVFKPLTSYAPESDPRAASSALEDRLSKKNWDEEGKGENESTSSSVAATKKPTKQKKKKITKPKPKPESVAAAPKPTADPKPAQPAVSPPTRAVAPANNNSGWGGSTKTSKMNN